MARDFMPFRGHHILSPADSDQEMLTRSRLLSPRDSYADAGVGPSGDHQLSLITNRLLVCLYMGNIGDRPQYADKQAAFKLLVDTAL